MNDALAPDAGLILGEHLRSHPLVVAQVGTRSSVALATGLPAVRYAVTSCRRSGPEEWEATGQVECWADRGQEKAALDTARAVIASLEDIAGQRSTGYVALGECTNAFSAPDNETGRPRVIVLVTLLLFATDPVESL